MLVGIATVACVTVAVLWVGGGKTAVTVDAAPDRWTAVDVSSFASGAHLVFFARGPFRVRTANSAPVLIGGEGGDVDLNDLSRNGLEVRSATGAILKITVSKAKS